MNTIIKKIRQELKQNSDQHTKAAGQNFFKETVRIYGVMTRTVHAIARAHQKDICTQPKEMVFAVCDELWKSGFLEESFIACDWSYNIRKKYKPGDFVVFEKWVNNYVSNWASCDTLCNHTIGAFIEMYPEYLERLKKWATSNNRWVKRASAVTLIIPARHGKFLKDIFEIADVLLMDNDDLVQKGYGWMLKAASQAHQNAVFDYVMKHKTHMPRTALRYAIEKMPKIYRARAMEKHSAVSK